MKEGTGLPSAVSPLTREARQVATDSCNKESHVTKESMECISVTVTEDGYCSHQIYPAPFVLSGSTTLGPAGHCQPSQGGLASWSGCTLVEQYAEAVLLCTKSKFHWWFSACSDKVRKVSISQPISVASRMNAKFRKRHIFNDQFWWFHPVPKWKGLMFSKVWFFLIKNNFLCQDNAASESYMFTAYTLKHEIYKGINCFCILNHSKDGLPVNSRKNWGSRKYK